MAGTSDQISNFMFGTKKPYDLGVKQRFWLYVICMLQKPYESDFSRTSGNAVTFVNAYTASCPV